MGVAWASCAIDSTAKASTTQIPPHFFPCLLPPSNLPPSNLPPTPHPPHTHARAPPPTADNALNYAAILDTAADVAKAMLHLHRHQVVHSDLKVRNVLLKSDGTEGRRVVAKGALSTVQLTADYGESSGVLATDCSGGMSWFKRQTAGRSEQQLQ